jgi:hypothetical protein
LFARIRLFVGIARRRAAVAQSVEQRIRNAKVTSSIPVSGTRIHKKPSFRAGLFFVHAARGSGLSGRSPLFPAFIKTPANALAFARISLPTASILQLC